MISGGIEVYQFPKIRIITEEKFGDELVNELKRFSNAFMTLEKWKTISRSNTPFCKVP